MNQKLLSILLIISLGVNAYLAFLSNDLSVSVEEYQRKEESASEEIKRHESFELSLQDSISELNKSIEARPKNRIIYIERKNNESEKIAKLDSLTRDAYLDSIWAAHNHR